MRGGTSPKRWSARPSRSPPARATAFPDLAIIRTFLVKLFSKSFEERRLFEKRRHPKTFIFFINLLFSNRP
ncbi:hypothetical protein CFR76_14160 [Komagataeibacter swingsii]|uniref:Uncharacterized protein n=1 Tax=Komagataeibacter swingsii TaxID=215220 RepID=A0A2V4R8U5_9PROT|nr:hypothetical protein CFR76_14160 [Komagataeibacter swingsii]